MGTMHTESKKVMCLLPGAKSSQQLHNCTWKRNSFITWKTLSLNVCNEPTKHRTWSYSQLRRWKGKGEAEEKG